MPEFSSRSTERIKPVPLPVAPLAEERNEHTPNKVDPTSEPLPEATISRLDRPRSPTLSSETHRAKLIALLKSRQNSNYRQHIVDHMTMIHRNSTVESTSKHEKYHAESSISLSRPRIHGLPTAQEYKSSEESGNFLTSLFTNDQQKQQPVVVYEGKSLNGSKDVIHLEIDKSIFSQVINGSVNVSLSNACAFLLQITGRCDLKEMRALMGMTPLSGMEQKLETTTAIPKDDGIQGQEKKGLRNEALVGGFQPRIVVEPFSKIKRIGPPGSKLAEAYEQVLKGLNPDLAVPKTSVDAQNSLQIEVDKDLGIEHHQIPVDPSAIDHEAAEAYERDLLGLNSTSLASPPSTVNQTVQSSIKPKESSETQNVTVSFTIQTSTSSTSPKNVLNQPKGSVGQPELLTGQISVDPSKIKTELGEELYGPEPIGEAKKLFNPSTSVTSTFAVSTATASSILQVNVDHVHVPQTNPLPPAISPNEYTTQKIVSPQPLPPTKNHDLHGTEPVSPPGLLAQQISVDPSKINSELDKEPYEAGAIDEARKFDFSSTTDVPKLESPAATTPPPKSFVLVNSDNVPEIHPLPPAISPAEYTAMKSASSQPLPIIETPRKPDIRIPPSKIEILPISSHELLKSAVEQPSKNPSEPLFLKGVSLPPSIKLEEEYERENLWPSVGGGTYEQGKVEKTKEPMIKEVSTTEDEQGPYPIGSLSSSIGAQTKIGSPPKNPPQLHPIVITPMKVEPERVPPPIPVIPVIPKSERFDYGSQQPNRKATVVVEPLPIKFETNRGNYEIALPSETDQSQVARPEDHLPTMENSHKIENTFISRLDGMNPAKLPQETQTYGLPRADKPPIESDIQETTPFYGQEAAHPDQTPDSTPSSSLVEPSEIHIEGQNAEYPEETEEEGYGPGNDNEQPNTGTGLVDSTAYHRPSADRVGEVNINSPPYASKSSAPEAIPLESPSEVSPAETASGLQPINKCPIDDEAFCNSINNPQSYSEPSTTRVPISQTDGYGVGQSYGPTNTNQGQGYVQYGQSGNGHTSSRGSYGPNNNYGSSYFGGCPGSGYCPSLRPTFGTYEPSCVATLRVHCRTQCAPSTPQGVVCTNAYSPDCAYTHYCCCPVPQISLCDLIRGTLGLCVG